MIEPLEMLDMIRSSIKNHSRKGEEKSPFLSSSLVLIKDLEKLSHDNNLSGYTNEKLVSLRWHVNVIFGDEDGNGHSKSEHVSWAYGELNSLDSEQCFGGLSAIKE